MKRIVKTESKEDHVALISILQSLGRTLWNSSTSMEYANEYYRDYPNVTYYIGEDNLEINSTKDPTTNATWSIDAAKLLTELHNESRPILVKDVGEYNATVTKTHIVINSQRISFQKFQEIADAVAKMKKKP